MSRRCCNRRGAPGPVLLLLALLPGGGSVAAAPSSDPLPAGLQPPASGHQPVEPASGQDSAATGAGPAADPTVYLQEVVVTASRPGPEPRGTDPVAAPGFVTVLQTGERAGAGRDLAQLLGESVGVRSSSLGGLDSYSTLSLRGSSGSQVQVLLDGVPLNTAAAGEVDLASLPLEGIGAVEVFRGQVPVLLGGQAVGGAVNLVSRTAEEPGFSLSGRLGYGSFGTWDAALGHLGGTARTRWLLALSARRSTGDFPFHDDNGTPQNPDDDRTERRENNDVRRLNGLGRVAWRLGRWRLAAFADATQREAGLPGTGSNQATRARLTTTRSLLELAASREQPLELQGRVYGLLHRDLLEDPAGELQQPGAAPSSGEALTRVLGSRLGAALDLAPLRVELASDVRREWMEERADDPAAEAEAALGRPVAGDRSRLSLAFGAEATLALWGETLRLGPALRVEHLDSHSGGELADHGEGSETLLSPRFGVRLVLGPWTFKAGAGRYHRPPTFYELFGGRGALWGNPDLQSEQGTNLDLGVACELETLGPLSKVGGELVLFQSSVDSLITWMQTSQSTLQAANLGEARLRGAELALHAGLPAGFGLRTAYSLLDPENLSPEPAYHGKQLPLRAVHDLDLTLAWDLPPSGRSTSPISAAYRLTLVSGSYLDPANLQPLPVRQLHGVTLWLRPWDQGPRLLLEVSNLFDRRVEQVERTRRGAGDPSHVPAAVADFTGYPLPGRTLFASLLWNVEVAR